METVAYNPTYLQKLLGRNYKWWYLVLYSFKQSNIKLLSFAIVNFANVLDFSITIYLWLLIEPTTERISYFFVGFMLQRLVWSQYSAELALSITTGKIVNRLLTPVDNFKFWFFKELGSSIVGKTFSALLILTFLPVYINYLQLPSVVFIVLFPLSFIIGYFIDFCFSYILSGVAFWSEDYRPILLISTVLLKFLTGIAIPFSYLPSPIGNLLIFNPYSYINYHPMQIYLGKYSPLETFFVFLGGIAWCLAFYFLAKWVFKMGLKRNESVGL